MRTLSHALVAVLLLSGCACPPPATTEAPSGGAATSPDLDPGARPAPTTPTEPPPAAGAGDRTLAVATSDPLYARVEGTSFQNGCQSDGQCFVGGCSGQICSDQEGVISTCEWRPEYACYHDAKCEVQTDGNCGWTQTTELQACLANP